MTTTQKSNNFHDFKDGKGNVRAHRHPNGKGWVADTATVDDTAYIGANASVFGFAKVKNNARIRQKASISGYSVIKDQACIKGEAIICGSCTVKEHAEISGNAVIIRHTKIKDSTILSNDKASFRARDCLKCPALLDDNYTGAQNNPCLYCLEKLSIATEDDRSSIQSWMSKNGAINTNVAAEKKLTTTVK